MEIGTSFDTVVVVVVVEVVLSDDGPVSLLSVGVVSTEHLSVNLLYLTVVGWAGT